MATDLDKILTYQSIDLTKFEIRGARSGVNNARTTGPVYVDGTECPQYDSPCYIPSSSSISGDGSFSTDSSIVTDLTFDSPYSSLTTTSLKIGDNLTANSQNFSITNILNSDSFEIDGTGLNGTYGISFNLGPRSYLVEPDTAENTLTGVASFTQGDKTVTGSGTTWLSDLAGGDFIKHDGYQRYFRIQGIIDSTTLGLVSPYVGDTTSGAYTAKRWIIGRTKIKYAKNDITFDNESGNWQYDSTIGSDVTTSTDFALLADGIHLAFTRSLDDSAPDLMDVATEDFITLSKETQFPASQFSLPVVPDPYSFDLYINDIKKDQYPDGNQDYILNYSANPVYEIPPPPSERKIANVMFLDKITNVTPGVSDTQTGQFRISDENGEEVLNLLPGSQSISVDSTLLISNRDYVLEPYTGTTEIIESTIDEDIVKYVGINFSEFIDYGFNIYLNGEKQQISFPPRVTDDVLFQTAIGKLKPRNQDHPGPDDTYQINYMVESKSITNEVIRVIDGQIIVSTQSYPIKQRSVFLLKNGDILDEGIDYFVSYLSGRISFNESLLETDSIVVNYTPLSKQVNDITYQNGITYCTVHDAQLIITNADSLEFSLVNPNLNTVDIKIHRIYNETRDSDYSLSGILQENNLIVLFENSTNLSIGLNSSDIVIIDYTFESETTEYAPIQINFLNIEEGDETLYIENNDVTSLVTAGSILTLQKPDSASQYFLEVTSVVYDGFGTAIYLKSPVAEDITNPGLFISDQLVSFNIVPLKANTIVSGLTSLSLNGDNISNIFRPKTLLNIDDDYYSVLNAVYDSGTNIISLNSEIVSDITDSTALSNIGYSDVPVYLEGDTEIFTQRPIVTLLNQPGFIMNNNSDEIITVSADSSSLIIDGTNFDYDTYSTLGDMSSAIASADIYSLSLVTYIDQWQSDKIIPTTEDISVYNNSNTILYVTPALRYQSQDTTSFEDTTNFTVNDIGNIVLDTPLVRYDRYKSDYMGREFLGNKQVEYSTNYFIDLPAKSKISASFQYDNLDQFYIEVLNQRDFFDNVTRPRMSEEAYQLNGNVGQGGDIIGDEETNASDGGLTNDEFLRQDTEIECRVFENIYDFFSDRIEAMGNEMDAAVGLRLFNNDGIFNKEEQEAAYKVVNRIFPDPDYTNFEPMKVNPITGYFITTGAVFTNGSTSVSNVGESYWLTQLHIGDFIGLADSTKRYEIGSITNDSNLVLSSPFIERSTNLFKNPEGDTYTASTNYPIYDDDGNLGFKVSGTKSGNFGLEDGDVFDCYIDGDYRSYTFENPPAGPPVVPLLLFLLYQVKRMSAEDVARVLTSGISGMECSAERIADPDEPFGYRNTLLLRTDTTSNQIQLGTGDAVSKLGFTKGEIVYGNLDRTDHEPELWLDYQEAFQLGARTDPDPLIPGNEIDDLLAVEAAGLSNKLDRVDSTNILRIDDAYDRVGIEKGYLDTEKDRLSTEISATSIIIQEPSLPSYANTIIANTNALIQKNDSTAGTDVAYDYAADIHPGYQGKSVNWKWALDFTDSSVFIRGINLSGIGVPDSTGPGITPINGQTSFILEAPFSNDRRILNTDISGFSTPLFTPNIVYEDTGSTIPGTWTGWDNSLPVDGSYSINNQITFTQDSSAIFAIRQDPAFTTPDFIIDSSALVLNWIETDGPHKEEFLFNLYPTISNLVTAIDSIDGFGIISGSYNIINYEYANLKTESLTNVSSPPGNIISSGTLSPAFSMYSSDSSAPFYQSDNTALVVVRIDGTNYMKNEFLYTSYPTLNALQSAVDSITNITVEDGFDPTYNYGFLRDTSGFMASSSPGSPLYIPETPLFNLFYEKSNLRFETDTTAINILWEENSQTITKTFAYTSYPLVSSIKAGIDSITGVDTTGNPIYDSENSEAFRIDSGTISPTAFIYRGLRDATVSYQAISDKLYDERIPFAQDRSSALLGRINYLSTREAEIRSNIQSEEILRDSDGNPSDLYIWANNRFNRRQGCYARLKQIEKQIESNQSALQVNQGLIG